MSKSEEVCAICGQPGVTQWTIHSPGKAAIVKLCILHSKPFHEAVDAAGTAPKREEEPEWKKATELPRRATRRPPLEPLDWTPPEES